MSNWHWILIIVLVYLIGAKWGGPGQMVLGKVGL